MREDLEPYLRLVDDDGEGSGPAESVRAWVRDHPIAPEIRTIDFLVGLNNAVYEDVNYSVRMEPGVQTPCHTLQTRIGSCRDSAWLLVSILRQFGLAARFVSGYLVQSSTSDVEALDGPSGPAADFTDLHAWTEVYIPGAGWIGLDPTSGLFAGRDTSPWRQPRTQPQPPRSPGRLTARETTLEFSNTVTRIHEDPRVTPALYRHGVGGDHRRRGKGRRAPRRRRRPAHHRRGADIRVDRRPGLGAVDTEADGPHKRQLASALAARLTAAWAPHALIRYGQGKWYSESRYLVLGDRAALAL